MLLQRERNLDWSLPLPGARNEHRRTFAVLHVALAVELHEVALLEIDRDQDVDRAPDGEHEVSRRHRGRRPECREPADVQRVTDVLVEHGCRELYRRVGLALEV